jgi:5-oxoprolinase (ATP-hydrolysing) subunit A
VATIDLNADLGEGDAYDFELLEIVSSCNIACGAHAGDEASMRATAKQAAAQGVSIGAHPGYPDRAGRGRRNAFLAGDALLQSLAQQLVALQSIVAEAGGALGHVKLHGALYGDAARDARIARLFIDAMQHVVPGLAIVGPPHSALQDVALAAGLRFIVEAFVDRMYLPNGALVPRAEPGAVHADLNTITSQAVSIACDGQVTAQDGAVISIVADTLCIHGDTPNAANAARAVRDVLQANGVIIRAPD